MGLIEDIYMIASKLPKFEQYALASQMIRAAVSIASNIAEGWGRNTKPEFIRFLNISFGSTCELETQLFISQKQYPKVNHEAAFIKIVEVKKMLISLIQSKKATI